MFNAAQPVTKNDTAPRQITILGATGSIGCSTLDLIRHQREAYSIEGLTAQENVAKLIAQALEFRPKTAVIGNEAHYQTLKSALEGTGIEAAAGENAILDAASRPADWIMAAIVGAAGLKPTLKAIERGATIAFASKECLVCAGDLMMQACRRHNATLLPVDSEHNAIFQLFDFSQADQIERITLTASGGPFRGWNLEQMSAVTPGQAICHPKWDMGAKISVDSATMMNKGLELIEAYHLFPLESEQLNIIVHPESIIHSLVHYRDGSVLAQLGQPDMRIPIAYTLGWPQRITAPTPRLDLTKIATLHFEEPDDVNFPSLKLARDALKAGAWATAALNAANEIAVSRFLKKEISFTKIAIIVQQTLEQMHARPISCIEDALACDANARILAKNMN